MENIFKKTDAFYSALLGALIGALAPFILTNLKAHLAFQNYLFLIFAAMAPAGLYIFYLLSAKISALYQMGKFGIVGSSNFFVDLGVFNLIIYFSSGHAEPIFSFLAVAVTTWTVFKAISFLVANVNSYFWNKFWTFEQSKTEKVSAEYAQFLIISFIGFLVNVTTFSVVFSLRPAGLAESLWGTVGVVSGTIAGLGVNFIGYKFWVFKK